MAAWRKLKICWVFPGASLKGGVRADRELADAMARRGHDVVIACPSMWARWPWPWQYRRFAKKLWQELCVLGKPQHHLVDCDARLVMTSNTNVLPEDVPDGDFIVGSWWQVRQRMESWPTSKGTRVHMIRHHELHGGDEEAVRAVYRLPGLKVAVSQWLKDLMQREYGSRDVVLVPDGVDHGQFNASCRERGEPPTVGFMYGNTPWKGAETAIEALRLVQREHPEVRVVSFGAHPMDRAKHRPDNFSFHLRPSQPDIAALYRGADCWLVPSWSEGFGLPGLEAAACGCPVVSTRCGGPEDYVKDGESGYLVDVKAPQQMAEAILRVINSDPAQWRAMSQAAQDVAATFSWDRSAELLEEALFAHQSGSLPPEPGPVEVPEG